jgi:hypothetical protein
LFLDLLGTFLGNQLAQDLHAFTGRGELCFAECGRRELSVVGGIIFLLNAQKSTPDIGEVASETGERGGGATGADELLTVLETERTLHARKAEWTTAMRGGGGDRCG